MIDHSSTTQRGNILFLILIVVALLAALFHTVSESMRGEDTIGISENRARIYGSELIDYSNLVANGVAQLRLRGVLENEICFHNDSWGHEKYNHAGCDNSMNSIYDEAGGGFEWMTLDEDLRVTAEDNHWNFYADNAVNLVGTSCEDASCSDLIMVADQLKLVLCQGINQMLDIGERNDAPPVVSTLGTTPFKGAFLDNKIISNTDINGKSAACVYVEDQDLYAYYKVLIAR